MNYPALKAKLDPQFRKCIFIVNLLYGKFIILGAVIFFIQVKFDPY